MWFYFEYFDELQFKNQGGYIFATDECDARKRLNNLLQLDDYLIQPHHFSQEEVMGGEET